MPKGLTLPHIRGNLINSYVQSNVLKLANYVVELSFSVNGVVRLVGFIIVEVARCKRVLV